MNLFEELKRRNVFRVGIAYVLLGWVVLQAADFALDLVDAPNWIIQVFFIAGLVGLPFALFFAWAFELTPEGIKREEDVDRSQSVTPQTGRRLDRAIIVFLILIIVSMGIERFYTGGQKGSEPFSGPDGTGPAITPSAEMGSDPFSASSGPPAKSIAVLPFADLSEGGDQGWFADGLAEEILAALARTPDLLVSSRTSAFRYKNSDLSIPEIAEELGVAHILEGSVRSAGNRIRVTAQLIRASDDFQVWSENYDRAPEDMIAIQEDLARSIADVLETTMDPAALAEMSLAGTDSVEAYRAYLKGVALYAIRDGSQHQHNEDVMRAYELFESARAIDPGFARAHLMAADFWLTQLSLTRSDAELTDRSPEQMLTAYFERIDLAIASASSDTDRLLFRGNRAQVDLRLREAIRLYSEYLEARPRDEFVWAALLRVASLAEDQDTVDRSLDLARDRGRTDPNYATLFMNRAYRNDRAMEAAEYGLTAVERWPTNAGLVYQTHRTLLWAGRTEEARRMAERYRRLVRGGHTILDARDACARGDRATVERLLADIEAASGSSPGPNRDSLADDVSTRWHLHMLLGKRERANEVLRPLAETGVPYLLAGFLIYHQFDPGPFPTLGRILEREGIGRPPASAIPFACPPPEQTAIAVLPFVNMSANADNEYFSDGVSEEILNVLAAVPDLKVASRTSAFRYKDSELSIGEIADELGVTHVLEGSVRRAGDQVRITAQLIQADDGFHLWSDSYDRQLTNIFAIQDEIAGSIAEVLEVQLLGERKGYVTVQDLSPENYEKFLKARFLMRQRSDAAMAEAIILTEEVLRDAPEFPLGLAQLAEARVQQLARGDVAEEEEIQALVDRALALEPDLAAAHMINGNLAMFRSGSELQPLEAYRHLQRAIELDPSEPRPHHWQGLNLSNAGYLERAREELEIAVQLEPDHANANGYLGFVLLLLGDLDGAEHQFELQQRLGNDFGALRSIHVAVMRGDFDAAQRLLEQRQGIIPEQAKRMELWIEAAREPAALPAFLAYVAASNPDQWHLALELMILGRYDEALAREFGSYPRLAWANRWAEARNLPRFGEMIETTGLPGLWDVLGPPPACRRVDDGYDCTVENNPNE